jgi:hypothetical protein
LTQTNRSALKYSADGCGWYDGFSGFISFLEFQCMCGRSKKLSRNFNKPSSNEKLQFLMNFLSRMLCMPESSKSCSKSIHGRLKKPSGRIKKPSRSLKKLLSNDPAI